MLGQLNLYPIVIAGGSGTRLWPLSRTKYPKQFHKFFDTNSLLQNTLKRLNSGISTHSPLIICNSEHRFIVTEQLQQIGIEGTLILEPILRNTAPAIALGAIHLAKVDPDAVMLVLPADHWISDNDKFIQALDLALVRANAGNIVTFGIIPVAPETGYGYIEVGAPIQAHESMHVAHQLIRFVEKPNLTTAQEYFDSGDYLWNSGIFCFTVSTYLTALKLFQPTILAAAEQAYAKAVHDKNFIHIDEKSFAEAPNLSIDYAVMEKITEQSSSIRADVIPMNLHWNDVGSWAAIWKLANKDEKYNAVYGDVLLEDSHNCYIHSENRLVAAVGMENCIIIETNDAILVANKNNSQAIGKVVDKLKSGTRTEHLEHALVHRPWGSYKRLIMSERYQAKLITVKPFASLSLQKHHHRAEHWVVVKGSAKITRGEEIFMLYENQSTYIPQGVIHRLENLDTHPLELIEIQSGSYLGEDDIVRFDDQYGRVIEKDLLK